MVFERVRENNAVVGILSGYMIEENPPACQLSESVLYVIRFNFKRCICLEIIS